MQLFDSKFHFVPAPIMGHFVTLFPDSSSVTLSNCYCTHLYHLKPLRRLHEAIFLLRPLSKYPQLLKSVVTAANRQRPSQKYGPRVEVSKRISDKGGGERVEEWAAARHSLLRQATVNSCRGCENSALDVPRAKCRWYAAL